MPRNLYARVEVLFPVKDQQSRERICNEVLAAYLSDTRKARVLEPDGCYTRPRSVRNGHGFSAQEHLIQLAQFGGLPLGGNGTRKNSPHLATIIEVKAETAAVPEPLASSTAAPEKHIHTAN
jgi:hypothetical protein